MSSATGGVWEVIEENTRRGGLVNMQRLRQGFYGLTIEGTHIDAIIRQLKRSGAIWFWGAQMIVVKPWNCPNCRRHVEERVSIHMVACLNEQRRLADRRASFGN
jgi:hypothetical protein